MKKSLTSVAAVATLLAALSLPSAATATFKAYGEMANPSGSLVHTAPQTYGTVYMSTQGQRVEITGASANAQYHLQISFHLELDGGTVLDQALYQSSISCTQDGYWTYSARNTGILSASLTFAWGNHSDAAYTDFYDTANLSNRDTHSPSHSFTIAW